MLRRAASRLSRGAVSSPWPSAVQARGLMAYVPSPGDGAAKKVTLIPGDGVGPELCDKAVVPLIEALGAPIEWERFDDISGANEHGEPHEEVPAHVVESIRRNHVCLKGVLYTPLSKTNTSTQSLNVQLRKQLDLSVNLIHGFSIPGIKTRFDDIDIVVIRENTEGEYSGLEHEVVPGVVESLKVITEKKSLRTAEYAFEFAFLNSRKSVTAVHKANIMKVGDGEFLKACRTVAERYPSINYNEMIVDNTCMQLVSRPHQFDVMVTPNLYGNLVCNIVAGLCGGVGLCPGSNIGDGVAVFEQGARHVAKDLTGSGMGNPTALLLSAVMMLRHVKLYNFSDKLEEAIMQVYEDADMTKLPRDVGGTANTETFTNAVASKLS
ncbi:unnamed protein product [Ostreobium quekettii]|uniref:Isopropylmalate dehydrogenase-like domain-containing protein n=1 Tax=Ostreobium quekettii TaxID=121088 RepID=A0A8S1J3T1_9CHLO|nr:unnamed protein product [Ostreobium quekettii]